MGVMFAMEELLNLLDESLQYDGHEMQGEDLLIRVSSKHELAKCPYCGEPSGQIHSRKTRTLKDLPMQGKKVKLLLMRKKYFCKNKVCAKTTFAERFDFFEPKATKTNRLQEEILRVSLTQSSVAASRYLRNSVVDVGKSTICEMLKKGRNERCG
jgi:transposase